MPNLAKKQASTSCYNGYSPCQKQPHSGFIHLSSFLPSVMVYLHTRFTHYSIWFAPFSLKSVDMKMAPSSYERIIVISYETQQKNRRKMATFFVCCIMILP